MKKNRAKKMFSVFSMGAALILFQMLSGCASSTVDLEENSPVAIVSVTCNSTVPWHLSDAEKSSITPEELPSEDGDPGLIGGTINKLLGASDPELAQAQNRCDSMASSLNLILQEMGIDVVDHDKVVDCDAYKNAGIAKISLGESDIIASGYKAVPATKKFISTLAEQSGAKALVFCDFISKKKKIQKGFADFVAKPMIIMEVSVYNAEGKILAKNKYELTGNITEEVVYKNGRWDKNELCDKYYTLIDRAVKLFAADTFVMNETVAAPDEAEESEDAFYEEQDAVKLQIPAGVNK